MWHFDCSTAKSAMCGIAGIAAPYRLDDGAVTRALQMRESIAHRGPDAAGLHVDGCAILAHRRLSIVDLSTGNQPLANEDQSVWTVFNGEIYNHRDIRRDLERRGHTFRGHSDTEVLPHLYEEHGPEFVSKLRGMFALAVYDKTRRSLVLARDRFGIKPLFYGTAA